MSAYPPHTLRLRVLIGAVGLLSACSATPMTPTPAASPSAPMAQSCQMTIGVITSLSGEYQARAQELVWGYDMARDDISASGGIDGCALNLIYKDDASTSAQAEEAMKALVETDRALVVAGSFASVITLDLVPLSSQYQIPLLAHNSTNFLITDLHYGWVFRTAPSSWNSMDTLLSYVSRMTLEDLPRVALLYEDSAYGQDIYVSLLSRLKTYGIGLVAALPIPAGASDYEPLLQRVRSSEANVLFMAGNSVTDGLRILTQMSDMDLNFQVYLTNGGAFTSSEFLKSPYAEYFMAPIPWDTSMSVTDDLSGQTTEEFTQRFLERYGTVPGYRSVNAYVNIYLAKAAIEAAHIQNMSSLEDQRLAIRDVLRRMDIRSTLFGPIRFNESGQNTSQISLAQVHEGTFKIIHPEENVSSGVVVPAPSWKERSGS